MLTCLRKSVLTAASVATAAVGGAPLSADGGSVPSQLRILMYCVCWLLSRPLNCLCVAGLSNSQPTHAPTPVAPSLPTSPNAKALVAHLLSVIRVDVA